MNIVLIGGNGYIGREVAKAWLAHDPQVQVYAISRSGKGAPQDARVHEVQADCLDPKALEAALPAQVDGIATFVGGLGGREANVPPAQAMLAVARKRDIPVMGFIGGTLGDKDFTTSKAEACNLLRASGRPVAIVEPTLVYGAGRDDKLAKMVPLLKFCGIFSKKLRPVRVEEVAAQLVDDMAAKIAAARGGESA